MDPSSLSDRNVVIAFEVAWEDVVGLDCRSSFLQDATVAFEAKLVTRKVFDSVG